MLKLFQGITVISFRTVPTGSRVAFEPIYTPAKMGLFPQVKADGAGSRAFLPHYLDTKSFAWCLRMEKFNLQTTVHLPSTAVRALSGGRSSGFINCPLSELWMILVEKGLLKFTGEWYCNTWAVSGKQMGKHVATERLIPGNQLITKHGFHGYGYWKLETFRTPNSCPRN
jgi:hypothetical protein